MSITDDIFKPEIITIPIENSGSTKPENCNFLVKIKFKPINGIDVYPDLEFISETRRIATAPSNATWLLFHIENRVARHIIRYDFLLSRQTVIDTFFNDMWVE